MHSHTCVDQELVMNCTLYVKILGKHGVCRSLPVSGLRSWPVGLWGYTIIFSGLAAARSGVRCGVCTFPDLRVYACVNVCVIVNLGISDEIMPL